MYKITIKEFKRILKKSKNQKINLNIRSCKGCINEIFYMNNIIIKFTDGYIYFYNINDKKCIIKINTSFIIGIYYDNKFEIIKIRFDDDICLRIKRIK